VVAFTVLVLITIVAMEPLAAALHRFVLHGPAWGLHGDHHDPGRRRFERNDVIPLILAALAMAGFRVGLTSETLGWLTAVALGVTVYGLAYAIVHDLYIHRRLPILPERIAWLEPLRLAHLEHHRHDGAPFGMLLPRRPRTPVAV
jgi:beta-carotene 3-hydroxylase